ncbi:glycosyltransferase [bacterium]|nr:glycosyltransferase [bacterium]
MIINIMCPRGSFGSLNYLANLMKQIIGNNVTISGNNPKEDYKPNYLNILIDEGISSVIYKRKADIWWTDTPAMLPNSYHKIDEILLNEQLFKKHYTVSEFNKQHYKELNIPVEETTIPRPINPILFYYKTDYNNTTYDIITIGKHCICDRKNLRLQREVFLKLNFRYCVISDALMPKRPNLTQFNFGSITDEQKARLLSKSKFLLWTSFAEGFGLPVLEAMAVGTIPIYTDVPAHNEFAIGIPIKPEDKIKSCCYGVRIIKYVINEKEVEEAVQYALSMNKEEYEDLQYRCMQRATEIYNDFINKLPLLLSV